MENASKALLIAGGVLIAILIIGLLMYLWSALGSYNSQVETEQAKKQLAAFNKQYESYQRQILRGTDISSVINKVRNNNRINAENVDFQISWQFKLRNTAEVAVLPAGIYKEANSSAYDNMINNTDDFRTFKNLYFRCSKIEYSSKNGRVNNIEFEEILYNELFD